MKKIQASLGTLSSVGILMFGPLMPVAAEAMGSRSSVVTSEEISPAPTPSPKATYGTAGMHAGRSTDDLTPAGENADTTRAAVLDGSGSPHKKTEEIDPD